MLIALKSSRQATDTGIITSIAPTATASARLIFVLKAPKRKLWSVTLKERYPGYRWSMANRLLRQGYYKVPMDVL